MKRIFKACRHTVPGLGACALWILAAAPTQVRSQEEGSTSKPETHRVEQGSLRYEVSLDAIFESKTMKAIKLDPEAWSDLVVVDAAAHGSRVREGDVLLRLEKDKLEEQIADLTEGEKNGRLSLEMAEAEFANLQKTTPLNMEAARREKYRAEEDYDYFVSTSRKLSERSARFALKSSEQRLANAREELEQLQKMYRADDLTEETEEIILERQKFAVESAEFSLESEQLRTKRTLEVTIPRSYEDLKQRKTSEDLSFDLSEVTFPNTLEQKQLALAKLRRDRKKAAEKLEELKKDLAWATVRAPIEGLVYYGACDDGKWTTGAVVGKKLVPGGKLTPKEVLMTLVDPTSLRLRAVMAEKDLAHVTEGARGVIEPMVMPGERLEVTLESISQVPEPSGGFSAVLSVSLPKASRLVPGMNGKVTFKGEYPARGVRVPSSALFKEDGDTYVYVSKAEGAPEKRKVVTGRSDASMTEVVEGLEAGVEIRVKKPE